MAAGDSFYFDTFDIKDGMCLVWEAEKVVEGEKILSLYYRNEECAFCSIK